MSLLPRLHSSDPWLGSKFRTSFMVFTFPQFFPASRPFGYSPRIFDAIGHSTRYRTLANLRPIPSPRVPDLNTLHLHGLTEGPDRNSTHFALIKPLLSLSTCTMYVLPVSITFVSVATIVVALRLYTRFRLVHSPWWDDWFLVFALVC